LNRIEDYQAFVAIVEKRSLTAAAHHLRRSLQSVSRSLAALEHDIGVELIRRTTRRLSPTDAGLAFYRRLNAALAEIEAAKLETSNRRAQATGLLRISGSTVFSPLYIVPALTEFLAAHHGLEAELELSDGYVDLIGEGYDLAIRIGELPDSTLKSKLLARSRRVVFGAPSYFAKNGRPQSPEDLLRHECIVRTTARDANAWPFKVNGRLKTVKAAGRPSDKRCLGGERGGHTGARHCQCAAVAGPVLGGSRRCRINSDRLRAAPYRYSCGLAGDQGIAG
jgi:DNA-binding transcriptional LysR family regulator